MFDATVATRSAGSLFAVRPFRMLAAMAVALSFGADAAQAVPVDPIVLGAYNTGVDGSGTVLANNAVDPHWTLVAPTAGSAFAGLDGSVPAVWLGNSTVSAWIGPVDLTVSPEFRAASATSFTYRTTVDLTGFIPSSVSLTGRWATDNSGLDIILNGTSLGLTTSGFTSFDDIFVLSAGFVGGLNTLDFVVRNAGTVGTTNPTGLRVEFTDATATQVPVPASLLLLVSALAAVAAVNRKPAAVA